MHTNKGQTFHNDINKVADMLLLSKEELLNSYSYLTEEDYNTTINNILYTLFTYEQRKEYAEFLVAEGQQELAEKILTEFFIHKPVVTNLQVSKIPLLDHLEEYDEADEEEFSKISIVDEVTFNVTTDKYIFKVEAYLVESDTYALNVDDITNNEECHREDTDFYIDSSGNFYDNFTVYPLNNNTDRQEEVEKVILDTLFGKDGVIVEF